MIAFYLLLVGTITLIFQTTLMKLFEFHEIAPDLSLIFIVWAGLRYGPFAGLLSGFFVGLVFDVYAYPQFLGAGMLVKSSMGYFVGLADDHVIRLDWSTKVIILGICFFLHDLLYNLLIGMDSSSIREAMIQSTIPEAIYTILISTIIFNLYSRKVDA